MALGKNVFTTGQIADIMCVAPRTATKWIDSGELKGWRVPGSKARRVNREDLVEFCERNGLPTHYIPKPDKCRIWLLDEVNTLYSKILIAIFDSLGREYEMEVITLESLDSGQPDLLVINYDLHDRQAIVDCIKSQTKILVLAHQELSQTVEALLKANNAIILRY